MLRRHLSLLVVMMAVLALLLSACGGKPASTPAPAQPATPTAPAAAKKPAVGGELNLRLAKDPDNFNPILSSTAYGSAVYGQVYATLFEFNEKWEPTPNVAESWSASSDGLTWTIKIRQGIKFHDGNDLTADDVAWTLNAIMDKDYKGPRAGSVKPLNAVTAPDKYTLKIELKEPYAPLFNNINYGILEKALFKDTPIKDLDKNPVTMKPVGAGPYKFVEYKQGQYVLLERNENWFRSKDWNGAPFIKTLRFKVIPDDTTAVASLENGEIDLDTPLASEITRMTKDDKGKLVPLDYERNGWGFLTLNTSKPPLDDKIVRQALTYGLDRQSMIVGTMDGRGVVPSGPIPPVSWAADSAMKALPYDKAKAKQLLEGDGYKLNSSGIYEKNGVPLKFTYYASSGSPLIEGIAQIAKKNWKDIGVDVDVQMMDFNAMNDNYLKPGKFDITFSGMSLGLDPDSMYGLFHSTQVAAFNKGRYNNPQVDKLLEQGRKESDPAKRKQIYSDFQKIFQDECPDILIYANKYTDMVSSKVKGGVVNYPGSGASFIYRWWINEQ